MAEGSQGPKLVEPELLEDVTKSPSGICALQMPDGLRGSKFPQISCFWLQHRLAIGGATGETAWLDFAILLN